MYFFSNSPVKWRLTKVVYYSKSATFFEAMMKRQNLEPEHAMHLQLKSRARLGKLDKENKPFQYRRLQPGQA